MAERKTGRKFIITYTVWCLDVWGGPPDEPPEDEAEEQDWSWDVNDRSKCGSVAVDAEETEYNVGTPQAFASHHPEHDVIVETLVDQGYLKTSVKPSDIEIYGESDSTLFIESAKDGEPLYQLEFEHSVLDIGEVENE